MLQGNNHYAILLAAIVKKHGGKYILSEEDISKVKEEDVIGIFYDPKTKSVILEETDAVSADQFKKKKEN